MLSTYFSESGQPTRAGLSPVLHLLVARPRSSRYQGYWFVPAAAAPPRSDYEQPVAQVGHTAPGSARRVAQPVPQASQPQPVTAEELTRDLAGWSLPQAAPLGRASASWLW
jgi:hypothetical protein